MKQCINTKSDFKLIIEIKSNSHIGIPFRFEFFTSYGGKTVTAEWDGSTYTNCRKVDDSHILVTFNDHGLPSGALKVRKEFFIPDEDFEDHVNNSVSVQDLDIMLTTGASTEVDPIKVVVAQTILKPVKGIDYFTYNEKNEWQDEIMSNIIGNQAFAKSVMDGIQEAIQVPFYEQLVNALRFEVTETLKSLFKASLKAELKSELKTELLRELKAELGPQ